MLTSLSSVRSAAIGAVGAGALTGAMLFGGTPIAQAAPAPTPGTTFDMAGPHGAPDVPLRPGGGGGGHGGGGHWDHGGWGPGWWGPGRWGGGGDWDDQGGWGGHPGWGNGGWGPPGLGYRPWWAW